jgi:hypothetical protein
MRSLASRAAVAAAVGDAQLQFHAAAAARVALAAGAGAFEHRLGLGAAAEPGAPARHGLGHRDEVHHLATVAKGVWAGTAAKEHVAVVAGVDVQHRYRP